MRSTDCLLFSCKVWGLPPFVRLSFVSVVVSLYTGKKRGLKAVPLAGASLVRISISAEFNCRLRSLVGESLFHLFRYHPLLLSIDCIVNRVCREAPAHEEHMIFRESFAAPKVTGPTALAASAHVCSVRLVSTQVPAHEVEKSKPGQDIRNPLIEHVPCERGYVERVLIGVVVATLLKQVKEARLKSETEEADHYDDVQPDEALPEVVICCGEEQSDE